MRFVSLACLTVLNTVLVFGADKYNGPIPPKTDIPYLLHADHLVETEAGEAKEETKKDSVVAILPGASSPVRTPLAEPIFIIKTQKLSAERISAFKLDVKNGSREVVINSQGRRKSRDLTKPIFVNVTRLGDNLYKIEIDQMLENGEYTLSPEGSSQTFSFEIY